MNRALDVIFLIITCITMMLSIIFCVFAVSEIYPFAMPFPLILFLCLSSCIVALCRDTNKAKLIRNGFVALSIILYILAVSVWPSGEDDGPAIGLVWLVGPLIILEMILGIISTASILGEFQRHNTNIETEIGASKAPVKTGKE